MIFMKHSMSYTNSCIGEFLQLGLPGELRLARAMYAKVPKYTTQYISAPNLRHGVEAQQLYPD